MKRIFLIWFLFLIIWALIWKSWVNICTKPVDFHTLELIEQNLFQTSEILLNLEGKIQELKASVLSSSMGSIFWWRIIHTLIWVLRSSRKLAEDITGSTIHIFTNIYPLWHWKRQKRIVTPTNDRKNNSNFYILTK